jgi:hypothetical protein
LCPRHERDLRLPDGRPLREALGRVAPKDGPLEGSLLGWIFNPVEWQGPDGSRVRAWTDFAAGGMAVLEDRYGAEDYFEFSALASSPGLDFLYALRLALDEPSTPRPVPGGHRENVALLWSTYQHVSETKGLAFVRRVDEGLRRLMDRWNSEARFRDHRAQVGRRWPDSYAELEEWVSMAGLAEPDARPLPGRTFFTALSALAERRFASPPTADSRGLS